MPAQGTTSRTESIKRNLKEAKEAGLGAIADLGRTAESLGMRETATKLAQDAAGLQSDTFRFLVMGQFKTGKSSLLNALLGGTTRPVDLGDAMGPMVVDDLPATATLTRVCYADEPYVKVWRFDNTAEQWDLGRYLEGSTLAGRTEAVNQQRFKGIREFEMGFPANLCRDGVVVYDSPGLGEHRARTEVTREATGRCDAAIAVFNTQALMGEEELKAVQWVAKDGVALFIVVNRLFGRPVDDKLRGYVWDKYVREFRQGPEWAGQDLSGHRIYFVNAQQAREGRYTGNQLAVQQSGIDILEHALWEFLGRERQGAHLGRYAATAKASAAAIEKHIADRLEAARTEREGLREAYQAMLPRLAQIQARPARLASVFRTYHAQAESALTSSFLMLIARIRQELPDHLHGTPLPSGEKFFRVYQQKKLSEEASQVVSTFVSARVQAWSDEEVPQVLAPVIERLVDEIEREVAAVDRELADVHIELGWSQPAADGSVVGIRQRVGFALASALIGDVGGVITGGAGGWRGFAGYMAGGVGAAVGMALLAGVIFWPAALLAGIAVGVLTGGAGLEKRVKEKLLPQADAELTKMRDEAPPQLTRQLGAKFEDVEQRVTAELESAVVEEIRHIQELVDLNQRDQADRERIIEDLADKKFAVERCRHTLEKALTIAQQVV